MPAPVGALVNRRLPVRGPARHAFSSPLGAMLRDEGCTAAHGCESVDKRQQLTYRGWVLVEFEVLADGAADGLGEAYVVFGGSQ